VPERFRVFRAWWRAELLQVSKRTGVYTNNTDEVVLYFRKNGVDQQWLNSFCLGLKAYRAEQHIEQRRNAANARWKRERQQKHAPGQQKKHSSKR